MTILTPQLIYINECLFLLRVFSAVAVSLPIVSVIVVAFFVFMSFVAHKRYPHIGETGKTRHRNKPPYVMCVYTVAHL